MIKKYNPKKITVVWNNIPLLGFMDGTFVDVEFAEDAVTTHVGEQGDVSLILNANSMATVTVTLIQGSPTNTRLSRLVPNTLRNSLPTGTFGLSDLNGKTVVSGEKAFIKKMPKITFGKTISGRAWAFVIPQAEIVAGEGGD